VNTVADKVPVDGLNWSFVEETKSPEIVPEVTSSNTGYLVALVVVSSVRVPPDPAAP
jgi:hypothetical protein